MTEDALRHTNADLLKEIARDPELWATVVAPWVVVQEREHEAPDG